MNEYQIWHVWITPKERKQTSASVEYVGYDIDIMYRLYLRGIYPTPTGLCILVLETLFLDFRINGRSVKSTKALLFPIPSARQFIVYEHPVKRTSRKQLQ